MAGPVHSERPVCNFAERPALLGLVEVPTAQGGTVKLMLDEGAQVSLVREEVGRRLSVAPPRPHTLTLQVVGDHYRPVHTHLYTLSLVDAKGGLQTLVAAGIPSIAAAGSSPTSEEKETIRGMFPGICESTLMRPQGQVDILIGVCDAHLLPFGGRRNGSLRLEGSPWAGGEILRGSLPGHENGRDGDCIFPAARAAALASLMAPAGGQDLTLLAAQAGMAPAQIDRIISALPSGTLPPFWECEVIGTRPRATCRLHKDCSSCREAAEDRSLEEDAVVERMDGGMAVTNGKVTVEYPWIPENLAKLQDNYHQARAVQSSVEAGLIKKGRFGAFTGEMIKAFNQGTFTRVPRPVLAARRASGAPMHYLAVFGVDQPSHAGHKMRVVANSAMKNSSAGISVNSCMEKPPNALVPLMTVLLWWRSNEHVAMVDLSRAYQALHTGTDSTEKFTRLFVWRRSPEDLWETYGYDRVTFGDTAAACALELAKRRAATLGRHIHPATADQLANKMYSDDGALAGSSHAELLKMRGERRADGTYTGHISKILDTCGMSPKYIVLAGEGSPEEEDPLGGAMLGVGYECSSDRIVFSFPPVFHRKAVGGVKPLVTWSDEDLASIRDGSGSITLRECLSYVMSQYDPLGLASPIRIREVLLLRRTHAAADGWDVRLPADIQKAWGGLVTELAGAGSVFFPRAVTSRGSTSPYLVGFGDGSMEGLMGMVYAVWPRAAGGSDVRLVIAKSRVAPLSGTTVPRMEMSSAGLAARLALLVARSAAFKPVEVVVALDSECSVAALQKRAGILKPFFANRAAEVEESMSGLRRLCPAVGPIVAIPGHMNPADIGTRDRATPADISPSSMFQRGPDFLQLPRIQWPLRAGGRLDPGVAAHTCLLATAAGLPGSPQGPWPTLLGAAHSIMHYTNNLDKATRILAITVRAIMTNSLPVAAPVSPPDLKAAWRLMVLASAPAARAALSKGDLRSLGAYRSHGSVRLRPRCSPDDIAAVLGISELEVVMPSGRLAYLVMVSAHCEDHRRDPRDVMARARRRCWIPRARRLAVAIVKACPACRRDDLKTVDQQMGDLPSFKILGVPPFTAVGCDFMGPYSVRGMCGGRRRFKVWVAAYTCFSSHAAVFLATPGYDAATFITTHTRFCNTFGAPDLIIVDHGPNLVAAAERPDWKAVAEASGWPSTTWKITPKACPWRAGQAERVIGMAKTTMHRLLAGHEFVGDFHQFEALLARVAWLLNSRPVATRVQTDSDFHLISPNDIILGRAARSRGDALSPEDLEEPGAPLAALTHMERVARAWHAAFVKQAWPTMMARGKWKEVRPNVAPGDFGYTLFTSKFGKPTWRPCRVLRTHPDHRGVVRTVTIGMKNRAAGEAVPLRYVPKPLVEMVIGVQRLAITLPAAEQALLANGRDPATGGLGDRVAPAGELGPQSVLGPGAAGLGGDPGPGGGAEAERPVLDVGGPGGDPGYGTAVAPEDLARPAVMEEAKAARVRRGAADQAPRRSRRTRHMSPA
jgi:hypothetical protein